MTSAESEEAPRRESKATWERPALTPLGNVKDLIRANGKGSGGVDSGPTFRRDPG
jgi:hypothetical protein